jgi:hypothetical protein
VPDKYRKGIESNCFKFIWDGKIPPVLFLFINNPEKDPKVSISLNAIYISSLDVQNKVVSSASCDILML